jgi:predicted N-acetyltransferase YhbS
MKILIRKMRSEDMHAAMDILSGWNMAPFGPTSEIADPIRSSLDIDNSFVALDGDKIVGVCSYVIHTPEIAETASLAVYAEYQGKGIGYSLQVARLRAMKAKGIRKLITHADRPETIGWYVRKFGYKKTGKEKKKHPWSRHDIDYRTVLELDLDKYEFQ